jgi:hypothetical protein
MVEGAEVSVPPKRQANDDVYNFSLVTNFEFPFSNK